MLNSLPIMGNGQNNNLDHRQNATGKDATEIKCNIYLQ